MKSRRCSCLVPTIVIGTLMMISSGSALSCWADDSGTLPPETVEPITLPQIGEPFVGPGKLAGESGFFWTRFGTEEAIIAMKEVPILQEQVRALEDLGAKQAKQIEDESFWTTLKVIGGVVLGGLIVEGIHAIIGR